MAEIGDSEQRNPARIEPFDDGAHPLHVGKAVVEARPPERDQFAVLGVKRAQFGAGIGEIASHVVLMMPRHGDDIGHECIKRPIVADQAPVQGTRFPSIKDVADVKDDGFDRHRLISPGGP